MKKLNALKSPNCWTNSDPDKNTDYARAVSSSALTEYCSYTNYLDYLQSNINSDYSRVVNLEQKIGNGGEGKKMPETMMSVARAMNIRTVQIQSDVDRATSTLQKSAVAYREMERTYMLHLMLLIIYDDYLELRQNMNTYLNAVSQLFEKAKNAQSANQ